MNEPLKFKTLETELSLYKKIMGQAADTILEQEVSKYPIFVAHQQQVDMGILLVDKEQTKGNWSIQASTLEEFVTKQLILPERVEEFKKVYKNPEKELCIFVLSELGATFNFLPRL